MILENLLISALMVKIDKKFNKVIFFFIKIKSKNNFLFYF